MWGQNKPAFGGGNTFGQPAGGAFGQPAGGGFGAAGGAFGAAKPTFGQPGAAFGQPAAGGAFGATAGGGFGQPAAGGFGQPATSGVFGAGAFGKKPLPDALPVIAPSHLIGLLLSQVRAQAGVSVPPQQVRSGLPRSVPREEAGLAGRLVRRRLPERLVRRRLPGRLARQRGLGSEAPVHSGPRHHAQGHSEGSFSPQRSRGPRKAAPRPGKTTTSLLLLRYPLSSMALLSSDQFCTGILYCCDC